MSRSGRCIPRGRLSYAFVLVVLLLAPAFAIAAGPSPGVPETLSNGDGSAEVAPAVLVDPAIPGDGIGRILVTTADSGVVPNDGLLTNLTGFRVDPFPNASAFQIGAEEVLGQYLAVFGLFQNSPLGPVPFFSVFNNTTGRTVYQVNESYARVNPGDAYDFALRHTNGTNWTLRLDGQLFDASAGLATFDFGVTSATYAPGLGFSVISLAQGEAVPPSLNVPTVLGVHRSDGWYLPRTAAPIYVGDPSVKWGIVGENQTPSMFPGEISTGTSFAPLANGTGLWIGGPVPGSLTLTSDPTETAGGATTLLSMTIAPASGGRVGAVPLILSDSLGGAFVGAFPQTDPNGSASSAFVAPNLTISATDQLLVIPRLLGLAASAEVTVRVVPASQILLSAPDPLTVSPGGSSDFRLRATNLTGFPAAGLLLALFTAGFGTVSPDQGVTDLNGSVTATVSVPRTGSAVTITVVVTTPGFWGKLRIPVVIASPAPSLQERFLGWLPWILIGAAAVGLAGLVLRRRPPKRPLPALDVRKLVSRGGPVAPGSASERPDVPTPVEEGPSRTPPSAGTP